MIQSDDTYSKNTNVSSVNQKHFTSTNMSLSQNTAEQTSGFDIINSNVQNYNELSELIIDNKQPWQVHNCKLLKLRCSSQGTLPFIYHYDKLPDFLKHEFPLTGTLLTKFDEPMTAQEACELIGVASDTINNPKFIKITGSIVIFMEPLQLAVRMHWSNTSKQEDIIYCQNNNEAIKLAMQSWQFIGRVDTLFKQGFPSLTVYDNEASSVEKGLYLLPHSPNYHPMPHNFAISLLEKLETNRENLTWIDEAIQVRIK